jgi:hypothetical protein
MPFTEADIVARSSKEGATTMEEVELALFVARVEKALTGEGLRFPIALPLDKDDDLLRTGALYGRALREVVPSSHRFDVCIYGSHKKDVGQLLIIKDDCPCHDHGPRINEKNFIIVCITILLFSSCLSLLLPVK